ncbi:dNTP triphosphohydrolase [Alcaligenes aquatilis]|uniref:deoxyguanosinetriphosphate triphosphohydrolase family protein n=1 Tax=Alcaligenes aquatilis TaxID=323284 RepID=UPI000F690719|nr:dNTP triphosphohydrolase [Alcaligenes aquatilis]QXR34273.1 dNTP triphosphohydrolase [Alcaligenes aquatilis]
MAKHIPLQNIWSPARRPRPHPAPSPEEVGLTESDANVANDNHAWRDRRSEFQHDYDRLLFSTPVRRLADKTQVWPMEENDSVRTRLTHSHEVANLARSIGVRVYLTSSKEFELSGIDSDAVLNVIQPILLATGLGHDLGNPPFGHQGEAAIGGWFAKRKEWIFTRTSQDGEDLERGAVPEALHSEFTEFDGNPQGLRLLTRLQTHVDDLGLDLTAATLAAGLKYPICFDNVDPRNPLRKKGGYFSSEKDVVEWVREHTGLKEGQRHPLTWIMEACDDIAYSVLDVDDVLKKQVMSPDDVLVILRHKLHENSTVTKLLSRFREVEKKTMSPHAQHDIKIQYLRAFFIEALVTHASEQFIQNIGTIFDFSHQMPLMDNSQLCSALKKIAKQYAFNNPLVLRTEALGAAALDGLMCAFWLAISDRTKFDDIKSRRKSARSSYIFSLISPNYIEQACAADVQGSNANGMRYRELRLLTDMISGMTDTYAMRLWSDLQAVPHVNGA